MVRIIPAAELRRAESTVIRAIMDAAFADDPDGEFADSDWDHALGGTHVVLEVDGRIVSHASVVQRAIEIDDHPFRTGYVEAVATVPQEQGRGHGTAVMTRLGELIRERFELGVLGTGLFDFYGRLGWERWMGPGAVRTPAGLVATPDDDGYLMILRTPTTGALRAGALITCEWRPGDVW